MWPLLRNNNPFTALVLLLATLLLKWQSLRYATSPEVVDAHFLFKAIVNFLKNILHWGPFAFTLAALIQIFIQALYLNFIASKHKLFSHSSIFPALTYIMLTSLAPNLNYFSEALLINWLVLWGIDICMDFAQTLEPRKKIFNAGMVLGIPLLIQYEAASTLLLLGVGLLLLRTFQPAEWFTGLLGFITPLYFLTGILFLVDNLSLFTIYFSHPPVAEYRALSKTYWIMTLGGTGLLFSIGFYRFQQQTQRMVIYTRRKWLLILCYIIWSAIFLILSKQAWILLFPGLSLLIAQSYYMEKTKWFRTFIFLFSCVLVIFSQIAFFK